MLVLCLYIHLMPQYTIFSVPHAPPPKSWLRAVAWHSSSAVTAAVAAFGCRFFSVSHHKILCNDKKHYFLIKTSLFPTTLRVIKPRFEWIGWTHFTVSTGIHSLSPFSFSLFFTFWTFSPSLSLPVCVYIFYPIRFFSLRSTYFLHCRLLLLVDSLHFTTVVFSLAGKIFTFVFIKWARILLFNAFDI